jgi:beta-lactamase regulating signal transducer with metallopeptidase domain
MINYLLKSGILLLVFYAVYKIWLENEKIFRFNRAYLLLSLVFSFVVPLQLFSFKPLLENGLSIIQLEGIVIRTSNVVLNEIHIMQTIFNILMQVYVVVAIVLIIHFILNLLSFYRKIKSNEVRFVNGVKVILIKESILPHSFWKSIFINKEAFENGKIPSELIAHEKAHLKQKHTLDILFIEVLQIIFWFNPLIVLYKKAIKLNHEFLADEAVNKQFGSVKNYQSLLLDFASDKNTISLASNINYLITKKRLLMMTKNVSPFKIALKTITTSVVCFLVIFTFSTKSAAQKVEEKTVSVQKQEVKVTDSIEKQPEFPGGIVEFYKFIGKNFKMPAEASKNKIEGKVLMEFMVEKDGSLSEFKIKKDLGYGLGAEAERVLKLSPKWNPGTQEGQPIRVMYALPITIQADK